jgi:hypothetical protein
MCAPGVGNGFLLLVIRRLLKPGSMIPVAYGFRKPPGTVCL